MDEQRELQKEYVARLRLVEIAMNRLLPKEAPWVCSVDTNDIRVLGNQGKLYLIPNLVFFGKLNALDVIKWLKTAAGF